MTLVKSFSVGNGDMFYIRHGSDNFSVIDCSFKNNATKSEETEDFKRYQSLRDDTKKAFYLERG